MKKRTAVLVAAGLLAIAVSGFALKGTPDLAIGTGVCGALSFDPTWYAFGVRAPIALQLWPLGNELLEVFLEVAPAWVPLTSGGFTAGNVQAQCALGFRLGF